MGITDFSKRWRGKLCANRTGASTEVTLGCIHSCITCCTWIYPICARCVCTHQSCLLNAQSGWVPTHKQRQLQTYTWNLAITMHHSFLVPSISDSSIIKAFSLCFSLGILTEFQEPVLFQGSFSPNIIKRCNIPERNHISCIIFHHKMQIFQESSRIEQCNNSFHNEILKADT